MDSYSSRLNTIKKCIDDKDYDIAISECNKMFIHYPERLEILDYLIGIYGTINNIERTIEGLELLVKQLPSSNIPRELSNSYCILYNKLAESYFVNNNKIMAVNCYKKIISVNNCVPDIYINMAVCYSDLKRYNEAIISLIIRFFYPRPNHVQLQSVKNRVFPWYLWGCDSVDCDRMRYQ